ncbi:MAG: glycosyltransferase family 4 protein [Oligoflexia bacterium]|nr:glycosyltransferase family 4 protein [Oligoflexia bacterium]
MFTVGLDTSALLPGFKEHALRGIGRYVLELRNFFLNAPSPDPAVGFFNHTDLVRGGLAGSLIELAPFGRTTLRQQLLYPVRLGTGAMQRFNLVHFPAHMDAPAWSPKSYIVTVLDLIPLIFKDLYKSAQPGWRYNLARALELRAIRNASFIITISQQTARDINRLLGVPLERIAVTELGVGANFFEARNEPADRERLRAKFQLPVNAPIVLYVGGIDQRKNIGKMLQAVRALREMQPQNPAVLVMAGKIDQDRQYPGLIKQIEEEGLARAVRLAGYLEDDELIRLYSASSVFLFPSLYEGFGLPPLEALAAGLPVVSSNASAMPEVLEGAALLCDPQDSKSMAQSMYQVLTDRELAGDLAQRGRERARQFSWTRTGEKTLQAYKRATELRR